MKKGSLFFFYIFLTFADGISASANGVSSCFNFYYRDSLPSISLLQKVSELHKIPLFNLNNMPNGMKQKIKVLFDQIDWNNPRETDIENFVLRTFEIVQPATLRSRLTKLVPIQSLKQQVQNLIATEFIKRKLISLLVVKGFSVVPDKESTVLNKNLKSLIGTGVVDILTYQYMDFVGLLPRLELIDVKKLTDEQLSEIYHSGNKISSAQIESFFGIFKPVIHEVTSFNRVILGLYISLSFAANPSLINEAGAPVILLIPKSVSEQTLKQNFTQDQQNQIKFNKWKEAFTASEGREPNPETYPEDRQEWDFQHSRIFGPK